MTGIERVAGSFRDPAGFVFMRDGTVYRAVAPEAAADFRAFVESDLFSRLRDRGAIVETRLLDEPEWPIAHTPGGAVAQHATIPFVSYPYEWPFALLKAAALLHLGIQIESLEAGFVLSDSSAYNIQFVGARPVFIDALSFRPYVDDEVWGGQRQFAQQFLNPLLLQAITGVTYQSWFRGTLEGIDSTDLARLLPWRSRFSPSILAHVIAPAAAETRATQRREAALERAGAVKLPRAHYLGLLRQLEAWVQTLEPRGLGQTTWQQYDADHSYADDEHEAKRRMVAAFCERVKPARVLDLGCNTGEYTQLALASGAGMAVGMDYDQGALAKACRRAVDNGLDLLPLWQDAANPSPGNGWRGRERTAMADRSRFDAVLALAVEHHLAIGRNIPLEDVVDYLVGLAPQGIVEFVPKSDPMIRTMLALRGDIFADYSQERFEAAIRQRARILDSETISSSGRVLYAFDRT